jgi:hypothetical protein
MADPLVRVCQQPAPSVVKFDASGPEHRPQAGGVYRGSKVAAQVRPPLGRYLRPGGHHTVERLADIGEIKPDCPRWLAPKLREAGDRRAQIPFAARREPAGTGKPIEHGLQRCRGGCLRKRMGLHGSL